MGLSRLTSFVVIFAVINIGICGYAAQDAANSSKNKEQIANNEVDVRDQGSSKMDIDLTRKIRQEVVAEKTLSSTAKNIKIITRSGHVTLKGPVQTTDEKKMIGTMAVGIAGGDHVNNEIEVINN